MTKSIALALAGALIMWDPATAAAQATGTAGQASGRDTTAAARVRVQARPAADTVLRLQPLRVRGLLADDVAATPGAASILTAASLRDLRPASLHDALDGVAGVRTIDDDILGRRGGIGVRGAPSRRSRKTLLLEDGSPINSSVYLDPGAHYTPPVERLERVEVLKGAGQLVYGPLNNHGIINFRNHRPGAAPRSVAEVGAGDHGTFRRHALHSRTVGPLGILGSYTGTNADGTFDVERQRFDDFYAAVAWDGSAQQRLEGSVTHFRERFQGYDEANLTPLQFESNPRSKLVLGEGREFNNFSVDYWKVDAGHEAGSGPVRISTRAFATRLDRPRFATRGTAPTAGGVMEGRDRLYRTAGAETRLSVDAPATFAMLHTVQAGLRHERHFFDYARPVGRPGEALDVRFRGDPRAAAGVDGYTRNGRLVTYHADAWSLFVQDAVQAGAWIVTPGFRVESYRQGRHVEYWPGSSEEGSRTAEAHLLVLPGISLLRDGGTGTQFYAGVHRGFAPATARTDEFPLIPETGVNSQLGVRTLLRGVAADVALFYNRISDTLIRDDVDSFGEALFVNTADSRVYGIDAALRGEFGVGALTALADGVFSHATARFHGGPLHGNRIPEVPRNVGSLTAGARHGTAWQVSGTVSHFGAFFADKENTRALDEDGGLVPGRTLLSAAAHVTLPRAAGARLWLQGRNLADVLYVSDVQDGLRPGAPRSIVAGISIHF
jgi:Fe(3+) dicitrate transport protein